MSRRRRAAGRRPGQVMAGVIVLLAILLIIVPSIVKWVQMDTQMSVKDSHTTTAFNLAQAAIDRGMWKLKSSTGTWADASAAKAVAGYQFDVTYNEVPGGTYRTNFSSGLFNGSPVVTVWGEGRDALSKETRSIQAVYQNMSVPGGIMSGGTLADNGGATVFWGPEVAQNNIIINNTSVSYVGHNPRKLSAQVVSGLSGSAANYYDTNGLTPPNTDNIEWWSAYDVPELPQFDFTTSSMSLRNQAVLTNTLNCYGNWNATNNQVPCGVAAQTGSGAFANFGVGDSNFQDCLKYNNTNHVIQYDNRWNSNYVWYWDNDVNFTNPGMMGTVIVRGNLWVVGDDWYGMGQNGSLSVITANPGSNCRPWTMSGARNMNLHVPASAWMEYQKLDTANTDEYPADNGYHNSLSTYTLGSGHFLESDGTNLYDFSNMTGADLGVYGFIYVGGNANFSGPCDVYGAIWVVGNWTGTNNVTIFFNDQLNVPSLNVALVRQSWKEVPASTKAWP